ncbi:protein FAM220A [Phyllostomus discolor]|uniref:Protein FAM220A n=1 Tax=Phyllostomus discolor TaxID=89673 RepID=A0A6J2N2X0_9CHIR|nr:protein FAM220A [Phyllostomus discolor]
MRGRRGALGAEAWGEDGDEPLRSLRMRESPRPSGAPSRAKKPAVDLRGNPHSETWLLAAARSDRSEASLLPRGGTAVRPCVEASVRRSRASPVAQSEPAGLLFAPAEELAAGGSCGGRSAPVRDRLGGGPGAAESRGGRCRGGEPRGPGLQRREKPSGVGVSGDEPSAFLEARGPESEPPGLHPVLLPPPHACPRVFLSDGAERAAPGRPEPALPEPTEECRKVLPSVKRAAADLQAALGLPAARACQGAELSRHR